MKNFTREEVGDLAREMVLSFVRCTTFEERNCVLCSQVIEVADECFSSEETVEGVRAWMCVECANSRVKASKLG
jgi:hypothetical protein